jgi:hypothetical protein
MYHVEEGMVKGTGEARKGLCMWGECRQMGQIDYIAKEKEILFDVICDILPILGLEWEMVQ